MAKYKVGKGKSWEKYCMEVLQTMYEAGIDYFSLNEFASWAGLPYSSAMREFLAKLVQRGWITVEPAELRDKANRRQRVYRLISAVWFGVKTNV